MNTKSPLLEQLRDKSYRDAYVASQLRIGLPMQCRALRESRGWTQPQLAEAAGMSQPRISEIERPGERKPNLETLLRLASAFDVALQVRFVPFEQFADDDNRIDLDNFHVMPFEENLNVIEQREEKMKSVYILTKNEEKVPEIKKPSAQAAQISTAQNSQISLFGKREEPNPIMRQLMGVAG